MPTVSPSVTGISRGHELSVPAALRHIYKTLHALARHGQHRNDRHGLGLPDHSRLDQLRIAHDFWRGVDGSLGQDSLQSWINLGREEVDLRFLQQLAAGVIELHREPSLRLGRPLGGDIDVRFEVACLIHRVSTALGDKAGET